MATIERRASHGQNVYYVKVRRKGYPPQSATFHKLSDAKRWAQMTEGAIVEGRYFSPSDTKRHTINDLLSKYRQDVFPQKRSSTVYNQVYHLQWWEAQLGHYALSEITPALIVEYRDKLARTRKNSTVRRYLAVLSHAFTVAVEWQWVNENPVSKVRKPKEPRGRVRFLTDDERERLLAACKVSRSRYLYLIVVLAISTGARRGELLSLRWPDVDLKRCTLTFQETKNGERRAVPCTGHALDLLKQHAEGRRLDISFVFPDAMGKKPLSIKDAFANSV
jgi:integrase